MTIKQETSVINGRKWDPSDPGSLPSWSGLYKLPAALPICSIAQDTDVESIAALCVRRLSALRAGHLSKDALWRDTFGLTGTMRTFYGATTIETAWNEVCTLVGAGKFSLTPDSTRIMHSGAHSAWVHTGFTFQTSEQPATKGSGFLSIIPSRDGGWKIWVLRTILEQLEGERNVDYLEPHGDRSIKSNGVAHMTNGSNGIQRTNGHSSKIDFDCVVVGAGQAGLSTGGRLQALGASYVVVDSNSRIGDNWLSRYDSTRLHTNREYAHLPFERLFGPEYQEYLDKYDLAKGHQEWVKRYGINVWLSTTLHSGSWSTEDKRWSLVLKTEGGEKTVTTSHVVFAVGAGCQIPLMPKYPNQEAFSGVILHSADYKKADGWRGMQGIVVGSANTAHDVAQDMVQAGLSSVTMIQRARTYVLPTEYYYKVSSGLYNSVVPIELADRLQFSNPVAVGRLIARTALNKMASEEPERFDALENAGFKLERYGDITHHINERLGGHYMDVGASAMIADGLIKVKSDSTLESFTKDGLLFADGSELKVDVVVFATGFLGNLRHIVGQIFGQNVQDQVEDFWGLNPEGELYGAFKDPGHPGLRFIGGALGHARYYSRFIALQIKADAMGTPFPIYKRQFPIPAVKECLSV